MHNRQPDGIVAARKAGSEIVVFRSAKARSFCGAKGDYSGSFRAVDKLSLLSAASQIRCVLVTANAGQHCHSLADASGDSPTSGLTFSRSTRSSGAKIPHAFGTGTSIAEDASGRPRLFEIRIAKGRVFPPPGCDVESCRPRCTERTSPQPVRATRFWRSDFAMGELG